MGTYIHKTLGYGLVFDSYKELLKTVDINKIDDSILSYYKNTEDNEHPDVLALNLSKKKRPKKLRDCCTIAQGENQSAIVFRPPSEYKNWKQKDNIFDYHETTLSPDNIEVKLLNPRHYIFPYYTSLINLKTGAIVDQEDYEILKLIKHSKGLNDEQTETYNNLKRLPCQPIQELVLLTQIIPENMIPQLAPMIVSYWE